MAVLRKALTARILLCLIGSGLLLYALSGHPLYGGPPGFGVSRVLITAAAIGTALCALLPAAAATNMLVLVVSCLVLLAATETAGEVLLGARVRPIFQLDERLIFKLIPGRRAVMTLGPENGGSTISYRVNSDGFRGAELLPTGTATRVVVYGDSFIHAPYTAHDETFCTVLGSLLTARLGDPIEVVNAGVSAYGPDQEYLRMKDELPRLRPDLAIVAIFVGNDYGDLVRHKLFRLGPDEGLIENHWKLDPAVRTQFVTAQRESILKRALKQAMVTRELRRLHEAGVSNEGLGARFEDPAFLLNVAEHEYGDFVLAGNDVVTNTQYGYYSAAVSLTPNAASAQYEIALMRSTMRGMRDVAAQNGVALAFLFIPHPFDVTSHHQGWHVDPARFPEYDGRNQTAPVEHIAADLGIPYVSLYDIYRGLDANALYLKGGDIHWNARGQAVAARAMADQLLTRGLLPLASR